MDNLFGWVAGSVDWDAMLCCELKLFCEMGDGVEASLPLTATDSGTSCS